MTQWVPTEYYVMGVGLKDKSGIGEGVKENDEENASGGNDEE